MPNPPKNLIIQDNGQMLKTVFLILEVSQGKPTDMLYQVSINPGEEPENTYSCSVCI